MTLIHFTRNDGVKVAVNPERVFYIRAAQSEGTYIASDSNDSITVKEDYRTVFNRLTKN